MNVWDYFALAARVASLKDDQRAYRLGAVGVRSDGVLVAAYNGAVQKRVPLDSYAHAETRLLRKLDKNSTIYVVRKSRTDEYRMARPCAACQVALRSRKVSRVYYTIGPDEYGVMTF